MARLRKPSVGYPLLGLCLALALGGALMMSRAVRPPDYLTAPATLGDIEQTVLATGAIQPSQMVDVGAQVSGQVVSVRVQPGQAVRKGDVIALIDPAPLENALRSAVATLEQQQALWRAQDAITSRDRLELNRQVVTARAQASSAHDLEAAEAALRSSEANQSATRALIRQAEIAVDTAKLSLGHAEIIAPMDGVIVTVATRQGQTVNAVQSAPIIAKLANLSEMTVRAQISEADIVRVRAGQPVYFTILGAPTRRFQAALRAIEPAPESMAQPSASGAVPGGAVYYAALFDVPNNDGTLRPGMTAQVHIVLAAARRTLLVPSAALTRIGDGVSEVQVVSHPKQPPVRRRVRVGIDNDVSAQILSGLKAGEAVVVSQTTAGPAGGSAPPTGQVRLVN